MESRSNQADRGMPSGRKWPYPRRVYVMRILWGLVWHTIWKLVWWRICFVRTGILRLFGAKVEPVGIAGSVWIEMPWDLEIGKRCVVGPRTQIYNLGGMSIGNYTVISQDVYFCGGTHDYTNPTYPLIRKRITVGSYVWIAAGAFIHPGVTIGDGAVVGARAVVTKDVPSWTVVAGNPAKIIKRRTLTGIHDDAPTLLAETQAP